jgi:predicted PurR-regulated permease PerM
LAIWWLFDVVLVAVGAILIAVVLHLVAEPFTRWCKLPQSVGLVLSGLVIIGVLAGLVYLFGTRITAQFQEVLTRAEAGIHTIADTLRSNEIGRIVLSHLKGGTFSISSVLGGNLLCEHNLHWRSSDDVHCRFLFRGATGLVPLRPGEAVSA